MSEPRPIIVTRQDHERLTRLLETHATRRDAPACAALEDELDRATVVEADELPADVVAMGSAVRFQAEDGDVELEIRLVYPQEADVERGCVSILAAVGSALLGLSEGDSIDWPFPDGRTRRLRVEAVERPPASA